MDEKTKEEQLDDPPMHAREITLADGRYMIFFTFGVEEPGEADNV